VTDQVVEISQTQRIERMDAAGARGIGQDRVGDRQLGRTNGRTVGDLGPDSALLGGCRIECSSARALSCAEFGDANFRFADPDSPAGIPGAAFFALPCEMHGHRIAASINFTSFAVNSIFRPALIGARPATVCRIRRNVRSEMCKLAATSTRVNLTPSNSSRSCLRGSGGNLVSSPKFAAGQADGGTPSPMHLAVFENWDDEFILGERSSRVQNNPLRIDAKLGDDE
jgi:hypothetical protein